MHGYAWSYKLQQRHLCLPIAALEFLALALSFIIFGALLLPLPGEPLGIRCIVAESDALAPTLALQNDKAKAPIMQFIHKELEDLPEFQQLAPSVHLAHLFGPANAFSDPLSRGKWDTFAQLCRQLRVQPVLMPIPTSAVDLIDRVAMRQQQLLDGANNHSAAMGTSK